ncbi:hypothetical protein ABQF17_24805 [Mycolicibacterium elephantis]|uniref:Uncharacterized protein n=1 Tax=Mycolicibacterium elephantis TaxID=81858 RepID=A0A0M2ZGC7_9MYCO|nr:hypothetical protein [Mycolicibacterium elephantis]KKW64522.1 hypothetical protein AAV95_11575 [Mycolicibacterium elephantis]OBA69422.1 hypothetical protein A5633_02050 [Mycolicibacterium elephantis]OBB16788.1 hypothetical protein A5762_25070 [Mycolicibacterium elephantis]OBE95888.1 hypothetical protein A5776_20230 [Mycolicibacterium elephantis]ORA66976.1 hypothetical protein BST23_08625 [Mycolicibacterium elephantis]
MSSTLSHALVILVPLGLTAVLAALIWRGKGPHPATYQMSEKWTHEPILWASDEPAEHGHGHAAHPFTVGGGASGKW